MSDRQYVIWSAFLLTIIWGFYLTGADEKIGLPGAAIGAAAGGTPLAIFNLMLRLWKRQTPPTTTD